MLYVHYMDNTLLIVYDRHLRNIVLSDITQYGWCTVINPYTYIGYFSTQITPNNYNHTIYTS